jgi:integrase
MLKKKRLTKREIDGLVLPEGKTRERFYDSELPGFGITVYSSGRKAFFLQYGPSNRRRRMKLGDYGALTPDKAREAAAKTLGEIAQGEDPLAERKRSRSIPTLKDWVESFMVEVKRRKRSPDKDRQFLRMAVKLWGTRRIDEITAEDIRRHFEYLTNDGGRDGGGTPIRANRWLASLRACLQAAWREDKIPDNPARKVRQNPENPPRDRVLSNEELKRVLEEIDNLDDIHDRAAFTMLVETGARLSEVLRARWENIDLDEGVWRLPTTKSGRPQIIPLSSGTAAMLRTLPRLGPWVIPGRSPENQRKDLRTPWDTIKEAAGLEGVTIHDIRRTFGLHIARAAGLHVASRLLRHSDIRVTERVYAPLGLDDLRKGLEAREAVIVPLRTKKARKKR